MEQGTPSLPSSSHREHLLSVLHENHVADAPLDQFYQDEDHLRYVHELASACPISAEKLFELCEGDPALEAVFADLVKQAIRYIETIIELEEEQHNPDKFDRDMIELRDKARGFAHTAFIDVVNRMSRSLYRAGKDNSFFNKVIIPSGNGQYSRPPYTLFAMQFATSYYFYLHPELLTQ